ncbi:MAG: hypothetical protein PHW54_07030, partial [Candidatus Omnitrophica bacterium]|nr:hypothetical protein [Candidatus Omnitrophota bacterium]
EWGLYMLSAWRYNLTDNINGRIYFDVRSKLGVAEGFGANYDSPEFGKGDFTYYYTQERNKTKDFPKDDLTIPREFERYLIRWRHKWDIDESTNLISEYYKIVDSKRILHPGHDYNFLKEYFYREYEKDAQPLSYTSLHHSFNYSSLDIVMQKRVNRWYTQLEKLPEISYSYPSLQFGESPLYFSNSAQAVNFNYKHAVPSPSSDDLDVVRFDTSNKLSLPMKVAFINFTPFVKNQETYYTKDVYGSATVLRSIFFSGADLSTKFYRIFNVKTGFLGMDINGLRHIITPSVGYAYNHEPTVLSSKLRQFDGTDSITRSNAASLGLSNKLQTKRKQISVDLADLNISSSYVIKPKTGEKRGSNLNDIFFDLALVPYAWMRVDADTTYSRSGNRSDPNYHKLSSANYDISFSFANERSLGIGQRWQRKGSNQLTYNARYLLNPKWRFSVYHRVEFSHIAGTKRGLREQEYILSRDLHCWIMEVTYNVTKDKGEGIWFVFRLKAFPELEFGFDQSYHAPKAGAQ